MKTKQKSTHQRIYDRNKKELEKVAQLHNVTSIQALDIVITYYIENLKNLRG